MHGGWEAWWADNEAHKLRAAEEGARCCARQAHKFGLPFGRSRARHNRLGGEEGELAKYSPKLGFFFPFRFFHSVYGVSVLGRAGRQQFRCGNHWPGAGGDGIFLAQNRMLRLFTP